MSHPDLAARFEEFADWARGTSPLYATLSRAIAADAELLALAAVIPPDRAPPNVFLAAVHSLLLDDGDHPLAAYYPTCVEDARAPDADAASKFRTFCAEYREELTELLTTRRTQTNAVRRCAALLPAFEYVSRRVDRRPLALVEVGPSAGLNLCWDRYAYAYRSVEPTDEENPTVYGDPTSSVRLTSTLRDGVAWNAVDSNDSVDSNGFVTRNASTAPPLLDPPFPDPQTSLPSVASRVGLDLNPLDVTDPDDVMWLLGLVWPEHTDRHELLRNAIAIARKNPPELRTGDAVELLPAAVDDVPTDTPVCVFDTQARYQFDEATDDRYRELIRDLGTDREIHWLSGDEAVDGTEGGLWLAHGSVVGGELVERRLAAYQQHGRWVAWVDDADPRTASEE